MIPHLIYNIKYQKKIEIHSYNYKGCFSFSLKLSINLFRKVTNIEMKCVIIVLFFLVMLTLYQLHSHK